ncbi:Protein of unknown function DUF3295 [Phaffia rhodozyma]|uniref:DUF3295 domain-containing protein n=1 Tax=Phaffia rhodozyma TaxID=264483 RepID=A0A0F7SL11_PHARH|nr:Protein of unknown function DUF3295 [Phaffia rhodozyma]
MAPALKYELEKDEDIVSDVYPVNDEKIDPIYTKGSESQVVEDDLAILSSDVDQVYDRALALTPEEIIEILEDAHAASCSDHDSLTTDPSHFSSSYSSTSSILSSIASYHSDRDFQPPSISNPISSSLSASSSVRLATTSPKSSSETATPTPSIEPLPKVPHPSSPPLPPPPSWQTQLTSASTSFDRRAISRSSSAHASIPQREPSCSDGTPSGSGTATPRPSIGTRAHSTPCSMHSSTHSSFGSTNRAVFADADGVVSFGRLLGHVFLEGMVPPARKKDLSFADVNGRRSTGPSERGIDSQQTVEQQTGSSPTLPTSLQTPPHHPHSDITLTFTDPTPFNSIPSSPILELDRQLGAGLIRQTQPLVPAGGGTTPLTSNNLELVQRESNLNHRLSRRPRQSPPRITSPLPTMSSTLAVSGPSSAVSSSVAIVGSGAVRRNMFFIQSPDCGEEGSSFGSATVGSVSSAEQAIPEAVHRKVDHRSLARSPQSVDDCDSEDGGLILSIGPKRKGHPPKEESGIAAYQTRPLLLQPVTPPPPSTESVNLTSLPPTPPPSASALSTASESASDSTPALVAATAPASQVTTTLSSSPDLSKPAQQTGPPTKKKVAHGPSGKLKPRRSSTTAAHHPTRPFATVSAAPVAPSVTTAPSTAATSDVSINAKGLGRQSGPMHPPPLPPSHARGTGGGFPLAGRFGIEKARVAGILRSKTNQQAEIKTVRPKLGGTTTNSTGSSTKTISASTVEDAEEEEDNDEDYEDASSSSSHTEGEDDQDGNESDGDWASDNSEPAPKKSAIHKPAQSGLSKMKKTSHSTTTSTTTGGPGAHPTAGGPGGIAMRRQSTSAATALAAARALAQAKVAEKEAERQRTMFVKVPISKSAADLYGLCRDSAISTGFSSNVHSSETEGKDSSVHSKGSGQDAPGRGIAAGRSSGLLSDMFKTEREKREVERSVSRTHQSQQNLCQHRRDVLSKSTGGAPLALSRNRSAVALPLETEFSVGREDFKKPDLESDSEGEFGSADKLTLGTSEAQRRLSMLSSKNSSRSAPRNHAFSGLTALAPSSKSSKSECQYPPTTRPLPPRPSTPSPPATGHVALVSPPPASVSPTTPVTMPQQLMPAPSAAPQSPRTTRRQMLAAELPEELRKQLLWERMSRQRILGGGMINRSNSTPKLNAEINQAGPRPNVVRSSATEGHHAQSKPNARGQSPSGAQQPPSGGPPSINPVQPPAGLKRTGGVLNTNTLRPLTSTSINRVPAEPHPVQHPSFFASASQRKRPSFDVGTSAARPSLGLHRTPSRPFEIDSSDSEDEDKMDPATVLKRRNTHHGALDRMVKDDGWDADYRSHGLGVPFCPSPPL